MKRHRFAPFIAWASIVTARFFSESTGAQGLLGSHFGVPGIAGAYDYVVVGGGTAGLTVARRLAANASIKVAVIEAGDFYEFSNGNYSEIPAYATDFTGNNPAQKNPYLDWYQYTEPQPVRRCLFCWKDCIFPALVSETETSATDAWWSEISIRLRKNARRNERAKFSVANTVSIRTERQFIVCTRFSQWKAY